MHRCLSWWCASSLLLACGPSSTTDTTGGAEGDATGETGETSKDGSTDGQHVDVSTSTTTGLMGGLDTTTGSENGDAPGSSTSTSTAAETDEPGSETDEESPEVPVSGPPDPDPTVDTDNETLVHLATKFYGAQRSGEGPNWLLDGATCHTADGESIGADLSGGWHDAGDHLKPTLSNAFATYVLLKGFEVFGSSFADKDDGVYSGTPNGIPDVLDEVRYATDYLVKTHVAPDELVGMVGNTGADHSNWVTCVVQESLPPEEGGAPRPVSMDANADIAGITAGALALMAQLIRPYEAELAETYLAHAIEIYAIGIAKPMGSNPGLYGQTGRGDRWLDEMLCGAVELYRVTGEASYLTDALDFNARRAAHFWAPNWGEISDYCRHSLFVAGEEEAALEFWQQDVDNYAAQVSSAEHVAGIIFFDNWGSLRYAANAAFSAALFYEATGSTASRDLALSQLEYIKGDNEYDRSFVVGWGNNPPQEPHHRNAHGKDDIDAEGFLHVLAGALVGGPTAASTGMFPAGYNDDVRDFVGNEVALDYNAGFVGLAAFGVAEERR